MIKSATTSSRTAVEPTGRMIMPQTGRMDLVPNFRSSRDFEKLKLERVRLETFSLPPGWPIGNIPPEECARTGFFFLQDGDKVQCAFCRGVAGEWEEGDNPAAEHRRHFPRCPFVCNLPVGNIPIECEMEAAQFREQHEAAGIDVCGPFERYFGQESASVRGAQPLNGNMNDVATSLAIQVCGNGPVHNNLVTLQSRLKTFSKWSYWNPNTGQTPEALSEAGFFYIGNYDHVKCFYCDGGLRNWEPGDDPWLEHARWFPNCSFVVLNKGDNYVKEVSKTKPPVSPPLGLEDEFLSKARLEIENSSDDEKSSKGEKASPSSSYSERSSLSDDEKSSEDEKPSSSSSSKRSSDQESKILECKICMDNRVEVVFLPCGHLVSCTRCATALSNCAVCRKPIKAYVKTYLS